MASEKISKVISSDNSPTFFSEEFGECYHSKSGAIEESFEKFAKISNLSSVEKKIVSVLDVCFGVGYNCLAALVELMKNPNVEDIRIVCLELDEDIISKISDIVLDYPEYDLVKDLAMKKKLLLKDYGGKRIKLDLLVDDARNSVKHLPRNYFDFIFHDPFSPKVCPVLWTEEFFSDVHSISKKNAVLTTYSCARLVRDNLKSAGFSISDGIKLHRRGPSTIAIKQ